MAVSSEHTLDLRTVETISSGLDAGGSGASVEVPHSIHDTSDDHTRTLDSTTTPAATECFSDRLQLAVGQATIDLTALAGPFGTTIDMTDLRLHAIHFKSHADNTEKIKIFQGAANPFYVFGEPNGAVWLWPRDEVMSRHYGDSEPVTVVHCEIDFSSDDLDAIIDIHIVAG